MYTHTNLDIRTFHRTAVAASVDVVNVVTLDDLERPTPCAGWTLADLLAHMTVQHHGFAAAARGGGDERGMWQLATVADAIAADPAGTYAAAAADVLDAFSADGVLDATFALPEFGAGAAFPGAMAIGFHFVDYVVHGWDVARTIDVSFVLPTEVVSAVLPLALAVPDGEFREMQSAPSREPSRRLKRRATSTAFCSISAARRTGQVCVTFRPGRSPLSAIPPADLI